MYVHACACGTKSTLGLHCNSIIIYTTYVFSQEVVRSKYGVRPCQLRVYFHYQPTYYHLHVHYTHMCYWDHGCSPERAHLVEDVIDNIERDSDYYVKCSLTFLAKELDLLTEEYMKHKPEFFQ